MIVNISSEVFAIWNVFVLSVASSSVLFEHRQIKKLQMTCLEVEKDVASVRWLSIISIFIQGDKIHYSKNTEHFGIGIVVCKELHYERHNNVFILLKIEPEIYGPSRATVFQVIWLHLFITNYLVFLSESNETDKLQF